MNVYQVKNVIQKTECKDYIFSGLYCSEPIMSKDATGNLIDNYIVYARNEDCSLISSPQCIFGIYSDKQQTAYINATVCDVSSEHLHPESFMHDELMREAYRVYVELFPLVREMYQSKKDVKFQEIQNYMEALKNISGNTLFTMFEESFPLFFNWAKTL